MDTEPEYKTVKRICVGLLAHVDAGKTTLSEALLYQGGQLRKLGRVDHRDAFLDTFALERERGITIFSKQAVLLVKDVEITLLDTPGHADFSAEMERTMQVLDCAVLVISGSDGIQGHTLTLWRLLERYQIPTFLFINKMDLPGADRAALLEELGRRLSENCLDFGAPPAALQEGIAMCGEEALAQYLEQGAVPQAEVTALVARRKLFPCWFGSALRLEGVAELLEGLACYAPRPEYPAEFSARVYKIARDSQGARLTYLKVTGGTLRVKAPLSGEDDGEPWQEKPDQIRIYSGAKFRLAEEAPAGAVCAVTGLSHTHPGMGLGAAVSAQGPLLEPVLTYQVLLEDGCDPHTALARLRELEDEDPQLHLVWSEQTRQIHIQLMGEVQLEILQRLAADRFGLKVSFGPGSIVYRETIAAPVLGIGHFEPLRHYAEVHLLLEPGPRGSGVQAASACPEDQLDGHWQRLVLTHLLERQHPGVLTGAPLTDVKITLVAGRAHIKHTEGGDFRQATYRAVRQGLMQAQSVLLEPWYNFHLTLPAALAGRAMSDIQRMNGECAPPETVGEEAILTGGAPVSGLRGYAAEVAAYSRGQGRLLCTAGGFRPCADQAAAVAESGYDPLRDAENPPDSVFCAHGGGYSVPWDQVPAMAHVSSGIDLAPRPSRPEPPAAPVSRRGAGGGLEQDAELRAIFERTYGQVKDRAFEAMSQRRAAGARTPEKVEIRSQPAGPEYLLVDGYNIIFAWDELKAIAADNLDAARTALMNLLSNYQGYRGCRVILVFDAYKVPHGTGEVIHYHNIDVVYTKEAETADTYIERVTYQLCRETNRIRVATSDGPEQLIILGHGAMRVSASAFHEEARQVAGQIANLLSRNNQPRKQRAVEAAMEKALRDAPEAGTKKNLKKHKI